MKNYVRNLIAGSLFAIGTITGNVDKANAQTTELLTGKNYQTFDTKFGGNLKDKLNYFFRHRVTVPKNNKVSAFTVADLSYNLIDGLDAVGEVQLIPGLKPDLRIGLQHFKKFGDVTTYVLLTSSDREDANVEFITNTGYTKSLSDNLKLKANLETITDFGDKGYGWSTQRARLGLGVKKYGFGVAADFVQTPKTKGYNVGLFARINF